MHILQEIIKLVKYDKEVIHEKKEALSVYIENTEVNRVHEEVITKIICDQNE